MFGALTDCEARELYTRLRKTVITTRYVELDEELDELRSRVNPNGEMPFPC